MNLIDVHIAHMPNENLAWRVQCDASLRNEPINIFHIDAVAMDIRQARYNGFKLGTAPYVSFVDADDFVNPGGFQACLDVLEAHPEVCGVYSRSTQVTVHPNGVEVCEGARAPFRQWPLKMVGRLTEIHQLTVMRREAVLHIFETEWDDIPKMLHAETWLYWSMAKYAPWLAVDFVGYNWRVHATNSHRTIDPTYYRIACRTSRHVKHIRQSIFSC